MIGFAYNLKLLAVIPIDNGYWYTHNAIIILRNVPYSFYVYCIVVIIFRIFGWSISFSHSYKLMSPVVVEICGPHCVTKTSPFLSVLIHPIAILSRLWIFWNSEFHFSKAISSPHFVILNEWKYLFIGYGVLITDNQKLFMILYNLCYYFLEQREWWIGYHNITCFQIFDTFFTSKIAVAI